jgi:hypothetical protein
MESREDATELRERRPMNIAGYQLSSNNVGSILREVPTEQHLHAGLIASEAMGIKASDAAMGVHRNGRRGVNIRAFGLPLLPRSLNLVGTILVEAEAPVAFRPSNLAGANASCLCSCTRGTCLPPLGATGWPWPVHAAEFGRQFCKYLRLLRNCRLGFLLGTNKKLRNRGDEGKRVRLLGILYKSLGQLGSTCPEFSENSEQSGHVTYTPWFKRSILVQTSPSKSKRILARNWELSEHN